MANDEEDKKRIKEIDLFVYNEIKSFNKFYSESFLQLKKFAILQNIIKILLVLNILTLYFFFIELKFKQCFKLD